MRDIDFAGMRALLRWWPDYIRSDDANPNDTSSDDTRAASLWGSYQHIQATLQQRQLEKKSLGSR